MKEIQSPLKFSVYGRPQPQGSMRAFIPKGWKRPILTSDNKKVKSFRQDVAVAASAEMGKSDAKLIEDGCVGVFVRFCLVKPKSAKKRSFPTVKPDIDKLSRAVLDALTGVVFRDDAQVCGLACEKVYGEADKTDISVGELFGV